MTSHFGTLFAYVALFGLRFAYNHYAIAHAYNAANTHTMQRTHTHKAVSGQVEAKELLSG